MDYSCHKCGYSIEEGRPFCSQCGAPQIRVAVPDSMVPAVAGSMCASGSAVEVWVCGGVVLPQFARSKARGMINAAVSGCFKIPFLHGEAG